MLRKLYYLLPPSFRLLARKLVFLPLDLLKRNRPALHPPKRLIYTGGGDFVKIGEQWVDFFRQHTSLNENSHVLDIGSGIGRIAIPLTRFLLGRYEGFDPVRQGVDWCQKNITKLYPHFHFTYVDLFNDLYKSKGLSAETFEFPYEKDAFDLACAISVFTHMLPGEVENYLRESFKVLREGGYLVATFFILDAESESLMAENQGLQFRYSYGDYALLDPNVKSANVAYQRDYLVTMIRGSGFTIDQEQKGHWCGREKLIDMGFQDILVLKKG